MSSSRQRGSRLKRTRSDDADTSDEFLREVQVYEKHRTSLPKIRPYLRELWRRRQFSKELASSNLRAQHYGTFFGVIWLVLNPLLLALVYYMLVMIIRGGRGGPEFIAHLTGSLFIFYFASDSVNQGARTVVGGGKLILNTAFPRLLLTVSSTRTAFARFLPTVPVYFIIHAACGMPWSLHMLWLPVLLLLLGIFVWGVASFFATAQVYFRDTASFLPYATRMWLYLSPILWTLDDLSNRPELMQTALAFNPLYPVLGAWSQIFEHGNAPSMGFLLGALAWATGSLLIGGLFFMSREREFAVRL